MRLCFVGYGAIAEHHARAFRDLGASFDWVVGRDPAETARFAERFGFAHHTLGLDEALADPGVEAVVITSPSQVHEEQTRRSLEAGKHVLCEIPLALSLDGGRSLAELAGARGRTLMVAHTQRFWAPMVELRRRIAAGEVEPHHIVVRYGFRRHENVGWTGRRRTWTDDLIWHHGGHAVDTALWLLGAREVSVQSEVGPPHPRLGIPMNVGILFRTPRDELGTIALSYDIHQGFQDYVVIGERQTLAYVGKQLVGSNGEVLMPPRSDDEIQDGLVAQNREFVQALAEGRAPSPSADDVLPCLAALQAVQESVPSA